MRALISGGGIGGLAAGIALRRAGLDVEISESSSQLKEIGAGLMIWLACDPMEVKPHG
jgi:FAD-dependent urate hydroxylase